MAGKLPTARTLAWLRERGWPAQVVERWVPQARRRVDLFGCIDILALDGLPGSLGLQACRSADVTTRTTKALELPQLHAWLAAGNRFWVIGWALRGARGARKLWTARVVAVQLDGEELRVTAVDHDDEE